MRPGVGRACVRALRDRLRAARDGAAADAPSRPPAPNSPPGRSRHRRAPSRRPIAPLPTPTPLSPLTTVVGPTAIDSRADRQRIRRRRIRVEVHLAGHRKRRQRARQLPDGDRVVRLRAVGDVGQLAICVAACAAERHRTEQGLVGRVERNRVRAVGNRADAGQHRAIRHRARPDRDAASDRCARQSAERHRVVRQRGSAVAPAKLLAPLAAAATPAASALRPVAPSLL